MDRRAYEEGCSLKGFITTNYTYIGSEVTWPIYNQGTIGKAKEDLQRAARSHISEIIRKKRQCLLSSYERFGYSSSICDTRDVRLFISTV